MLKGGDLNILVGDNDGLCDKFLHQPDARETKIKFNACIEKTLFTITRKSTVAVASICSDHTF